MDPVALIVQALLIGATESMKETAGSAIRDVYQFLRDLLLQRLQEDAKSRMVLDEYEKDPEIWARPLEQIIRDNRMDTDQSVLTTAQALLNLCEPASREAKFEIDVKGDNVQMVTGDGATVTMTFNENSSEQKSHHIRKKHKKSE